MSLNSSSIRNYFFNTFLLYIFLVMLKLTCLSFIIFLFNLLFTYRIYEYLKKQCILKGRLLTKIGTFHIVFLFFLYSFFFTKPFWFWFGSFMSLLLVPSSFFLAIKIHQQTFNSEFLRFTSMILLKMEMGSSFQSSMEKSLVCEKWNHKKLLRAIYENVAFSQQSFIDKSGGFPLFLNKIIKEFQFIQNNQHQAVDRLFKFQNSLESDLFFRRKSRQIWCYFGCQWLLLTGIYVFILFFIISQYGFLPFINVFLISFSLYFTGILCLYYLGGSKKWVI